MKRTTFTGQATNEISFPLGGIGTGSIGLSGSGHLVDWDIRNKPAKGTINGNTHFALKAEKDGKLVDARVLCGDIHKDLTGQLGVSFGTGLTSCTMQGFPHFRNCTFKGEFPIAEISFTDPDACCSVKLTALNPFIPHNAFDSSIPAAFFEYEITNITSDTLNFSVVSSLCNMAEVSRNRFYSENGISGILLDSPQVGHDSADCCEFAIATDEADLSYQEYWYRGGWNDHLERFWRNLTEEERLPERSYAQPGKRDHASLCVHKTLLPGESMKARFVIAWYAPVMKSTAGWSSNNEEKTARNYYAYVFDGAPAAAAYCLQNWDRLVTQTVHWHDELFATTLPEEVVEAISATSSVLKTATCMRAGENGDFYGWEGVFQDVGSCHGSCTHVWNYAYALPFLFPDLERGIRVNDYRYNQRPSGEMVFRTQMPFDSSAQWNHRGCADGQLGGVMKVWREWKLSGDTQWLRAIWPAVKKSLTYAWSSENADRWDFDRDGMMEGRQHHTLDMELFGPSSWLEGFYLGALRAGAEMAEAMGESENAKSFLALFEQGKKKCAEELFNGAYFVQKVDLTDKAILERFQATETYWDDEVGQIKYQVGGGCLLDQLLAQWHADIIGLGDLFDAGQVQIALENMYQNNFKESMRKDYNTFRLFALNDESGAVICDWPDGAEKPAIPIPYAQETMHGFEYAFAGLLISRGFMEQGLRVIKSVRDRYRGFNRNPWNEIECGSNYARSMAAFAFLPILSGMRFDMVAKKLGFAPKLDAENFRSVWFTGNAWGNVRITKDSASVAIFSGQLTLTSLTLPLKAVNTVKVDGNAVDFTIQNGEILFAAEICAANTIEIA